jgi:prophage antirepressor-like protein
MNKIKIFQNPEFGAIRTISNEQGDVMFCGRDVAAALGYKKPEWAIATHVEADDSAKRGVIDSLGREQQAIFINESGLYALILSSKLPSARRFKHWVTSEVLPSIRREGGYLVARPEETDEEVLARGILVMQTTLQRRADEIARLQPKADYADEVLDSVSCLTTTQIAKELNMTGCELNNLLRTLRVQYRQSGQYLLYADYARLGYAQSRTLRIRFSNGRVKTHHYLVWTERGRYFIHRLVEKVG